MREQEFSSVMDEPPSMNVLAQHRYSNQLISFSNVLWHLACFPLLDNPAGYMRPNPRPRYKLVLVIYDTGVTCMVINPRKTP